MSERMPTVGLIGGDVEDSLSPAIHNAAYREMGIDDEFYYEVIQLDRKPMFGKDAQDFLGMLLQEKAPECMLGLSVTTPFKSDAVKASGQVDTASRSVEAVGAVNTLTPLINGNWLGDNTDWLGAVDALYERDVEIEGKRAIVIGTGGAAAAVAYGLAIQSAKEITMVSHATNGAERVTRNLQEKFSDTIFKPAELSDTEPDSRSKKRLLKRADIVVNAGLAGQVDSAVEDVVPVDTDKLKSGATVMDIVYRPLETPLVHAVQDRRDLLVIDGTRMLLHQAVAQISLFTGGPDIPINTMEAALKEQY